MRVRRTAALAAGLLAVALLAACGPSGEDGADATTAEPAATSADASPEPTTKGEVDASTAAPSPTPEPVATPTPTPEPSPTAPAASLAGRVIVVDPGHQLGNRNFTSKINASVDAGNGSTKACNTTGTATDAGVAEATINWEVSSALVASLRERGAEVILTREENSDDLWGPCIDVRGSTGNDRAELLVSIHADGADAADHGFHVLLPAVDADIYPESLRLGELVRSSLEAQGIDRATYITDAMRASDDYGTLNHSTKPAVILEMGNMRHSGDAQALTTPEGQARYAAAVTAAVESYFAASN